VIDLAADSERLKASTVLISGFAAPPRTGAWGQFQTSVRTGCVVASDCDITRAAQGRRLLFGFRRKMAFVSYISSALLTALTQVYAPAYGMVDCVGAQSAAHCGCSRRSMVGRSGPQLAQTRC